MFSDQVRLINSGKVFDLLNSFDSPIVYGFRSRGPPGHIGTHRDTILVDTFPFHLQRIGERMRLTRYRGVWQPGPANAVARWSDCFLLVGKQGDFIDLVFDGQRLAVVVSLTAPMGQRF